MGYGVYSIVLLKGDNNLRHFIVQNRANHTIKSVISCGKIGQITRRFP